MNTHLTELKPFWAWDLWGPASLRCHRGHVTTHIQDQWVIGGGTGERQTYKKEGISKSWWKKKWN